MINNHVSNHQSAAAFSLYITKDYNFYFGLMHKIDFTMKTLHLLAFPFKEINRIYLVYIQKKQYNPFT